MAENTKVIFYADEYLETPRNRVSLIKGDSKEISKNTEVFIKGILNAEEIGINISHSFRPSSGVISGLLQKAEGFIDKAKNFANEVSQFSSILPVINDIINTGDIASFGSSTVSIKKYTDKMDGKFASRVKDFTQKATDIMGKVNTYAQTQIDFSDAYMYNFEGTSISGQTSFAQILVNDGGSEKSALSQLNDILDYLVGDYGEAGGFVGITLAPHNFKTSLQGLKDESPEGTFTLYIDHYRFPGVVVSDIDIDFSRTLVKVSEGTYEPMYITIGYKVMPVIKYTKQTLLNWIKATSI